MKMLLITLVFTINSSLFAFDLPIPNDSHFTGSVKGKIHNVTIGLNIKNSYDKICVTYIESNEQLLGLVEDLYDCYVARKNLHFIGNDVELSLTSLSHIYDQNLLYALLQNNPDAVYILSDPE